jgi:hypothetical protein
MKTFLFSPEEASLKKRENSLEVVVEVVLPIEKPKIFIVN